MSPSLGLLVLFGSAVAVLAAAARRWSLYPSRRLLWAALLPTIASLGVLAWPAARWIVVGFDVLVVALAVGDAVTVPRRREFTVRREAGRTASLRRPHRVGLTIAHEGRRARAIDLRDGLPQEFSAEPAEFALTLPARSRAALEYSFRSSRRGAFLIDGVYLRAQSRLGLWRRLVRYPAETTIHVYPDMRQLAQYAVLARADRLNLLGVRRARRVGHDHDFERLRDYTVDDNYRHIDWRATARRQKLTVKDFQTSQSQRIVFLADCGRMMANQAEGLSLLDHSFNALLMLGYVALRQGDSVGLVCFSDEVHSYVPPRSGMGQMNRLLHASFDRFPRLVESRYDLAFRYLATHSRKRSLVVLITNLIDEVNARSVEGYLTNLVGRHLPLGVLLRDRRMFEAVEAESLEGESLYRAAAAAEVLSWRRQVLADLVARGVLAVDVFPEGMTAPLVNEYLQVKARHLL